MSKYIKFFKIKGYEVIYRAEAQRGDIIYFYDSEAGYLQINIKDIEVISYIG